MSRGSHRSEGGLSLVHRLWGWDDKGVRPRVSKDCFVLGLITKRTHSKTTERGICTKSWMNAACNLTEPPEQVFMGTGPGPGGVRFISLRDPHLGTVPTRRIPRVHSDFTLVPTLGGWSVSTSRFLCSRHRRNKGHRRGLGSGLES